MHMSSSCLQTFASNPGDSLNIVSLSKKFPHRAESRFRGVRDILAVKNGPLFHFKNPAEQLLNQWQDSERDRHMMAHGLLRIALHKNERIFIHGHLLKARKDGGFDAETMRWSLTTLQAKTKRAAAYSAGWFMLCHAIHSQMGWINQKGIPVRLPMSDP